MEQDPPPPAAAGAAGRGEGTPVMVVAGSPSFSPLTARFSFSLFSPGKVITLVGTLLGQAMWSDREESFLLCLHIIIVLNNRNKLYN